MSIQNILKPVFENDSVLGALAGDVNLDLVAFNGKGGLLDRMSNRYLQVADPGVTKKQAQEAILGAIAKAVIRYEVGEKTPINGHKVHHFAIVRSHDISSDMAERILQCLRDNGFSDASNIEDPGIDYSLNAGVNADLVITLIEQPTMLHENESPNLGLS